MPVSSQRSIKRWAVVYKTTTQLNNTTTFQAINDLIISNLQAWTYIAKWKIIYSTAATTTWIRLTVSWSSILNSIMRVSWPSTATASQDRTWTQATAPAALTSAPYVTQNIAEIEAKVTLSATWNINIQFASEVAWSAITILWWTNMEIQKIG